MPWKVQVAPPAETMWEMERGLAVMCPISINGHTYVKSGRKGGRSGKEGRTDLDECSITWEGLDEECGICGCALEGDLGGELAGFFNLCWSGLGEGGEEGEGEGDSEGLHFR
jgi:hypothetical protein